MLPRLLRHSALSWKRAPKREVKTCLETPKSPPGFRRRTWNGRRSSTQRSWDFSRPRNGLAVCDTGVAEACFSVFESAGRPSGEHNQLAWEVEDIEETVAELRARGV